MRIVIGCDQIGFALKEEINQCLLQRNDIKLIDLGCYSEIDDTPYPVFARKVCEEILSSKEKTRGILICGTGIGMSIAANKFNGIYAAVCHDIYSCERSILSNNINVICFGSKVINASTARIFLDKWLSLTFVDSPSSRKLKVIYEIEKENMKESYK